MQQHAERQVLPPLALPRIAPAALPRRLVLRHDHHICIGMTRNLTEIAVGGVRFADMNDLVFHICLQIYDIFQT